MNILAIETSCDETAVALVEAEGGFEKPEFKTLSQALYSQADKHAEYGGVYPTLAKREHARNLVPLLKQTLKESNFRNHKLQKTNPKQISASKIKLLNSILEREPELLKRFLESVVMLEKPPIDVIAVTHGPGLEPALWVGINFAKALSLLWDIPLVPINHMEGHIVSALLDGESPKPKTLISKQKQNPKSKKSIILFPAVALLVSGGHTELVFVHDWMKYELLGQTRDDAVGEAFDKVARILGLPYPGGPQISLLAEKARKSARTSAEQTQTDADIQFPRPMIDTDDYDFSFSGLKTAVLYYVKKHEPLSDEHKAQIAREFEDAAVDVLITKTRKAVEKYTPKTLIAAGGVIANNELRGRLEELAREFPNTILRIPTRELATDNAVMIGIAGYFRALNKEFADPTNPKLKAHGHVRLS